MGKRTQTTTATKRMPVNIKPMLCTLLKAPFNDPEYLYEIKWDGYRVIGYRAGGDVRLSSRSGLDYTKRYPPITAALKQLKHQDIVLDGEVVVLNESGKPDFDALQKFNGHRSGIFFYAFDILWMDGRDLMGRPLEERKRILKDVVAGDQVLRYSEHFDDGLQLYQHAQAMNLEGIIAKQRKSRYIPDRRGREWYKIPTEIRQEFVIGGWVSSESRLFRTLLFGAYRDGALMWVGHAGGGFKEREMRDILKKLEALETDKSPFANKVEYEGIAHWVRPELVANIKYATVTRSGKIRKPAIFQGFRSDKPADQVELEIAEVRQGHRTGNAETSGGERPAEASASNWPEVEREPIRNEDTLEIEGYSVRIYNVDRELWKGIRKADLIRYYHAMTPVLLPHVVYRPLSLYLKLKGPYAPGLYIKDMEGRQPEYAEVFSTRRKHSRPGKRDMIDYLVCNNGATLLYAINLGCIDLNPWTARTSSTTQPDYIVIDLDPSDEDFSKAVEVARAAKAFFDERGLEVFVKTSGKTGMHLFIPCSAFTFSQARLIAEQLCADIHKLVPDITTLALTVSDRGNKLYLDPNQNDYSDTVAAPYCVRPYKYPTVSAPLRWEEVNRSLDPLAFTIHTMEQRVSKTGDLFAGVLDRKLAERNDRRLRGEVVR